MGKSTLMRKVFPALTDYSAVRYAGIDMCNDAQPPAELMHALCSPLEAHHFIGVVGENGRCSGELDDVRLVGKAV